VLRALLLASLLVVTVARAADGEALFNASCAVCHQRGGTGSPGLAPPLAGRVLWSKLGDAAGAYLQGVMLVGLSGPLEVSGQRYTGLIMPPQDRMTDEELAAIGVYVLSALNTVAAPKLTPSTVALTRAAPPTQAALREMRRSAAE
jgi:mono/diheme cytochrome c family protein